MKLTLALVGRLWQYIGVAAVAQAVTRHVMVWGHPDITAEADVASSWTRVFIGASVGVILFWTGIYFEGRNTKCDPPIS